MTRTWIAAQLSAMLLAVPASAADWPLFRGNALQTGVAAAGLPDQLEVLWKFETQEGFEGAAAIAGDTVYLACQDEHLYAVDLKTGKEKWRYKGGSFKAPPSVAHGAVYVGDIFGMFHCVDAATGKKRWSYETGDQVVSGANFDGDQVLFGSYDENLYCLTKDGKLVWKFQTQGPVNASPAVADGKTFVAGCDSSVHVLDLTAKGKELAAVELGGQAAATAAVAGDHLYVGTMSNQVLAIDWKKAGVTWKFEAARRQQPFFASAAVTDGLVVVGGRDKRIWAIDRQSGKEVWSFATEGRVDSSPVVVGRRVFAGSMDGNLYELDLATGKERKRFALGGQVLASPAVGGNCLVVGVANKGVAYCLGAKR